MKLYWRYKKDGKWNWKPAIFDVKEEHDAYGKYPKTIVVWLYPEEEE